jgi:5-oxoprolinase (ATP-hydrolysing) subunit C
MLEVIVPGFETCIQDYPGRLGYGNLGYPPSGPFDSWSFRMANLLVGNPPGAAALECQMIGPALKFLQRSTIAVTGADMKPTLDGKPVPMWHSVEVAEGQVLKLSAAKTGARAYIAIAGQIDVPVVLGSRSTFHECGVGGLEGHALKQGQILPVVAHAGTPGLRVKETARPPIALDKVWAIEAVAGPNDDWLDAACQHRFFHSDWKVTGKCSRSGYRLDGPKWTFSKKALEKSVDHGSNPSEIIDHGYPLGAVNLAGQTPIILLLDGFSIGGLINPYTVPTAAFWKLAQARPGETLHFREVTVDEAQALRRDLDNRCTEKSLERAE